MWVIVPRIIGTDVDSDTFGHPNDDLTQCLLMITWKYAYQVSLYPENCSEQGSAATPDQHKTVEVIDRWAHFYGDDPREGRAWCCHTPILGEKMALKQATTDEIASNFSYYFGDWALTSVDPNSDID